MDARNGGQAPDQHRQIAPHQRLAAGHTQLIDSQPHGDAREPLDLFEAQDLAARNELDAFLRHAIEAADIAAVGDTDPQIGMDAAVRVNQWGGVHRHAVSVS